jgi:hypothetical protein
MLEIPRRKLLGMTMGRKLLGMTMGRKLLGMTRAVYGFFTTLSSMPTRALCAGSVHTLEDT